MNSAINFETSNPDILFVIPPVLRFLGRSSAYFPLGLGYMVSYLKQAGIFSLIYNPDVCAPRPTFSNVSFAESWPLFYANVDNAEHPIWKEVSQVLKKMRPKIIGISSKTVDIPATFILVDLIKRILPDTKVIVGGPSAITCSEFLMTNKSIDLLVLGEGEVTVTELANYFLRKSGKPSLDSINGICYRKNDGTLVYTPKRPLIADIDEIPFPDRNSVLVVNAAGRLQRMNFAFADVLTSRGCPYRCTFCCAYEAWGSHKPRLRSVDNVIQEIVYLTTEFAQKFFIFWDDLFTYDRERTWELCTRLIAEKINITWLCLVRLNTIDAELLALMKQAGCIEVQVGIESGSERILKLIKKGITLEMIKNKSSIIRKSGIKWRIFLILGFPTETSAEIAQTLQLVKMIKPDSVDVSVLCPFPGTAIYQELNARGLIDENFMKSDMWNPNNNYTGTMSDAEFKAIIMNAFEFIDRYNGRIRYWEYFKSKLLLFLNTCRRIKDSVFVKKS